MGIADEIIHVYPIEDAEDHVLELSNEFAILQDGNGADVYYCKCKCGPLINFEGNNLIVIHNSFDGREGVEWVNEILNNE